MRYALVVLLGMLCLASPAAAQVSIGIGLPGVSIGINLPSYPELTPIPDYPVYYAPRGNVNLFFYDGMYWAYQRNNWYTSSWYNGPWGQVGPEGVPLFVLRIPVRYYRQPPSSWSRWQRDAPPHWGETWGPQWAQHRSGWDQWDHHNVQRPAPLPVYQKQYSGNRYPRVEQQQALERDKYRYQPQDPDVRQHFQQQQQQRSQPQPGERRTQPNQRSSAPPPPQQVAPAAARPQPPQERERGEGVQRAAPAPAPPQPGGPAVQRPKPVVIHNESQAPRPEGPQGKPQGKEQDRHDPRQPQRGPEQGQGQEKGQERGQDQQRGQERK